jgi:hypothetical protein
MQPVIEEREKEDRSKDSIGLIIGYRIPSAKLHGTDDRLLNGPL